MDKKKESHHAFLTRLCDAVEPKLEMNRYDRGFKRELAKALGLRDSTIQRWFLTSTPSADHLVKLYEKFNISPNTLLGVGTATDTVKPLDLHKIQFILGSRNKNLPEEFLDPEKYSISPILRESRSACHPEAVNQEDIESLGICRKDLVQGRRSVYCVLLSNHIGMSMWPVIKPGDIMIIDPNDKEIVEGAIFALRLGLENGKCTIRQGKKVNNNLILIPWFLREYQVEMINLDETPDCIVGRVVCSLTYLTSFGANNPYK
jgi:phage repressor protein C with HTH and peptisase S24 domain